MPEFQNSGMHGSTRSPWIVWFILYLSEHRGVSNQLTCKIEWAIWWNLHHMLWQYLQRQLLVQHKAPLLTHWGRVMLLCVSKSTIIGSDNILSHARHQAIIWTNAVTLLIRGIQENAFENIVWKIAAFLCRPKYVYSSSSIIVKMLRTTNGVSLNFTSSQNKHFWYLISADANNIPLLA